MRRLAPAWGSTALALSAALAPSVTAQPLLAPDPRPLGRGLSTFEAPADAAAAGPPEPVEPDGVLHLSDALAAALLGNPSLAARSYDVRAREAGELQARLSPNPTLVTEVEDVLGSGDFDGVRSAQTTIQLGQLVELGGKRAARVRLAAAERELAGWDYEAARIDVFTRAADAFVEVLAAQERLRLADEGLAVARVVRGVAARRVEAGLASPAERIRAGVAVDTAEVEREHADHELETARTALAALWGGVEARFERAEGALDDLPEVPPLAELQRRAADSPDLARWGAELESRDALLARARSQRVPDVTIAAGPRHLNGPGDTALVFGVSVPLPLWNRNQGALAEAGYRRAQAASEQRAAQVRVAAEVATARTALRASAEEAALLRTRVLPGIERAVAVLRRGYEEGRNSQLEVLDAERTRLGAREQYLRALVEAHHSTLQLERLTGAPLEERP
jgi:cobalt-zinc-cadmium efflux system outer membrane protein